MSSFKFSTNSSKCKTMFSYEIRLVNIDICPSSPWHFYERSSEVQFMNKSFLCAKSFQWFGRSSLQNLSEYGVYEFDQSSFWVQGLQMNGSLKSKNLRDSKCIFSTLDSALMTPFKILHPYINELWAHSHNVKTFLKHGITW